LLDNYARCVRIVRDQAQTYSLDPSLFADEAEHDLYRACKAAEDALEEDRSIETFLAQLVLMQPIIARFFDEVLVMADDRSLRENRLGLLQRIAALPAGLADLSELEGF